MLKLLYNLGIFCVCYTIIHSSFLISHYYDPVFYLWVSLSLLFPVCTHHHCICSIFSVYVYFYCTVSWTAANHDSCCSFRSGYCIVDRHIPSWRGRNPNLYSSVDDVVFSSGGIWHNALTSLSQIRS